MNLDKIVKLSGLNFRDWYRTIYLKSGHWKDLRKSKFNEVGRRCQHCGYGKKIQVHHKQYRKIFDVQLSDLEVLCDLCHRQEHANGNKDALLKIEKERRKRAIKSRKKLQNAEKKQKRKKAKAAKRKKSQPLFRFGVGEREVVLAMQQAALAIQPTINPS